MKRKFFYYFIFLLIFFEMTSNVYCNQLDFSNIINNTDFTENQLEVPFDKGTKKYIYTKPENVSSYILASNSEGFDVYTIKYTVKLKIELTTPKTISYKMYRIISVDESIFSTKYTYKMLRKVGSINFVFTDVIANKINLDMNIIDSSLYNITESKFSIVELSNDIDVENNMFIEELNLNVECKVYFNEIISTPVNNMLILGLVGTVMTVFILFLVIKLTKK